MANTELFWKMNTEGSEEDQAMREKHVPEIVLPDKMTPGEPAKIVIKLGGDGKHPNTNEHHFQWVELRMEDLYVARADFSPVVTEPQVEFTIVCPGKATTISAITRCNLHGLWKSEVPCKCC